MPAIGGRLCGVDRDPAMLGVARRRADIEWVDGTAASLEFVDEFELALMMGHALEAVDASGRAVRVSYDVEAVVGDVVTFTETTGDADGGVASPFSTRAWRS
jgi:ubiquinone/menaquinone biosynthesis C-methylase UbiE